APPAPVPARGTATPGDPVPRPQLAGGRGARAERLEGREALAVAAALTDALGRTADANALTVLAGALQGVAERLGPREAAAAAAALSEAMSKTSFVSGGMGGPEPASMTLPLAA